MKIKRINELPGIDPKLFMTGVEEISTFGIGFEIKAPTKKKKNVLVSIEGYASTSERDADGEIILPSAFDDTLEEYLQRGLTLFMHNWYGMPIGKTVEAWTDSKGLYVKADILDTVEGRDVAILIEAGVLDSFSVGFGRTVRNEDDDTVIEKLKLYENSVVNLGSNPLALFETVKENNLELQTINAKSFGFDEKKGKNIMSVTDLEFKEQRVKLEKMFGENKTALEDANEKIESLTENIGKQQNLMSQITEKAELLSKNMITQTDFNEFATKVGTEIQEVQSDIQTAKKAIKAKTERIPVTDWKSMAVGFSDKPEKDMKFVFNDSGTALPPMDQKAFHMFYMPIEFDDNEEGHFIKNLRDLHDVVYLSDAYFKGLNPTRHNITGMKSYKLFMDLLNKYDPEFAKAMYSTGAGVGDEWVPTGMSSQLYEAYALEQNIESTFPVWNMSKNPDVYPFKASHARMYRAAEASTNNPENLRKSNFGTGNVTFTAEAFACVVPVSAEFIEDSIIAVVPELRKELAFALADGTESWIINADDTVSGTHMDTAADWATDTAYPESYSKGLRKLAIAGSRTYDATTVAAPNTAVWEAADVRETRKLLPAAYGHKSNDIVYACTLSVWIDMLSFTEMAQFGTYAAGRTWATGDLTSFDGSRLILTSSMVDTYAATGLKTGSDTTRGLLAYNASAFKVGTRRGVTVEFEKNINTQQWSFVATQRKDFKSMDASGSEAVAYCINIPA